MTTAVKAIKHLWIRLKCKRHGHDIEIGKFQSNDPTFYYKSRCKRCGKLIGQPWFTDEYIKRKLDVLNQLGEKH